MNAPEFDGQPMTKREVLIAREAVGATVKDVWHMLKGSISWGSGMWSGSDALAERLYPLPKVTRLRMVADPKGCGRWAVKDGVIHLVSIGGQWESCDDFQFFVTAKRIAVWADLLANPTEEVEE